MSVQVRDEAPKAGGRWEWRDYLPADAGEAGAYAMRAMQLGVHPQAVLGFFRWCVDVVNGDEVTVSHVTASKYRKILLQLAQDRLKGQPDTAVVEYTGHDALLERVVRREIRATRQNVESRLAAA